MPESESSTRGDMGTKHRQSDLTVSGLMVRYGCHRGTASKILARIERQVGCTRIKAGREKLFPIAVVEQVAALVSARFGSGGKASAPPDIPTAGHRFSVRPGEYYIVQPDPLERPNRLKLGFSANLDQRLREYRALCPDLRVLRRFPQVMGVEVWAHRYLMNGQRQSSREVFDVQDVDGLLRDADMFFSRVGSTGPG